MADGNIKIDKTEMNTIKGIFDNCAIKAFSSANSFVSLKENVEAMYDGHADENVSISIACLGSGMVKMGLIYDRLSWLIETTLSDFVDVDAAEGEQADTTVKVNYTGQTQ